MMPVLKHRQLSSHTTRSRRQATLVSKVEAKTLGARQNLTRGVTLRTAAERVQEEVRAEAGCPSYGIRSLTVKAADSYIEISINVDYSPLHT